MQFGKKGNRQSAPVSATSGERTVISVELANELLQKLGEIAEAKNKWAPPTADPVHIDDVIRKALAIYVIDYANHRDVVLMDSRTEDSPIVRLTNAVLVSAIDKSIFEFQIPQPEGPPSGADSYAAFPTHLEPHVIRRLEVMTTPKTGSISLLHNGEPYDASVEFGKLPDGRAVARVKIVRH